MTVKAFLESLAGRPTNTPLLRLITGNQSADMDSVVSAISYAYFYHKCHPKEDPILPLVNISREEFRLRKDIDLLLKKHDISSTRLFFLDDVTAFTSSPATHLDVVLVDHCNLQGELLTELYEKNRLKVSAIIDHHADEGVFLDAVPRLIHSNGSCSALVFNFWNQQIGPISDKDAVSLLLGPLLIDTSNMEQKVEAGDREAYAEYGRVLTDTVSFAQGATTDLYSELKTAKKDLDGFSLYDILRKDYKQFKFSTRSGSTVSVGFSSIGKSLSWVMKKFSVDEVLESFRKMSETFHLDVVVVTSSFTQKETNTYTREFGFSTHKKELQGLASYADDLQLSSGIYKEESVAKALAKINKSVFFKVFDQKNTAASRKQVVPVIKQVVEQDFRGVEAK